MVGRVPSIGFKDWRLYVPVRGGVWFVSMMEMVIVIYISRFILCMFSFLVAIDVSARPMDRRWSKFIQRIPARKTGRGSGVGLVQSINWNYISLKFLVELRRTSTNRSSSSNSSTSLLSFQQRQKSFPTMVR
jgi:hypothetical protein